MTTSADQRNRLLQFASDNYAPATPEAWAAMEQANAGYVSSYGADQWTLRASDKLRELFEIDCEVYFCYTGTAANSMAIAHLCQSYHSVIAHETSHIETDECGGPEFFSHGSKLLLTAGEGGKIQPEAIGRLVHKRTDIHYPKPNVLSLTQSTEVGTVYSPAELDRLHESARRHHLRVHMDGSRFANAVASLGVAPKELTWKVGVDVLCFGGSKNGLPLGEAVIFFDRKLASEFDYRCKQAGQLASKMRYITAPWVGTLTAGAWLAHAAIANQRARQLAEGLAKVAGVQVLHPVEANAVFVQVPETWLPRLREAGLGGYTFIGNGLRLMCNWSTSPADVAAAVELVQSLSLGERAVASSPPGAGT